MKQYPARYWNDSDKIDRFTCGNLRWAREYFENLITVAFTPLGDGPLRVNREDASYSTKML